MLMKLMKHEFRATGRIMLPLYLVLLVSAVGANLMTRVLLKTEYNLLNLLATLLIGLFIIAVIGVCVMSLVLMVQRFYKNLLNDEGYVMLTLPASVHQQLWSKILVSTVWFAATAVAVALAVGIMAFRVDLMRMILEGLWELIDEFITYYAVSGTLFLAECLVTWFLGCISSCLTYYAAMAIGHSFSGHKVAWSVACYFIIQFVLQFLGGALGLLLGLTDLEYYVMEWLSHDTTQMMALHVAMGVSILFSVAYCAVFYCLTAHFLKNRLNLE